MGLRRGSCAGTRKPSGARSNFPRVVPKGEMVSSLLLRSMRRALYRPENLGHYGLASTAYCHFTSPSGATPTLVVHRMLKARLRSRSALFDQEVAALPWICEHSSDMEREADEAARESQELKMLQYLERFVGDVVFGRGLRRCGVRLVRQARVHRRGASSRLGARGRVFRLRPRAPYADGAGQRPRLQARATRRGRAEGGRRLCGKDDVRACGGARRR